MILAGIKGVKGIEIVNGKIKGDAIEKQTKNEEVGTGQESSKGDDKGLVGIIKNAGDAGVKKEDSGRQKQ